jgi:hypothetical protein
MQMRLLKRLKLLKNLVAGFPLLIASILIFANPISAQTSLNPSQPFGFSTISIVFQNLQFSGTLDYLRIYWNTSYIGTAPLSMGVKCYLNCNPLAESCDTRNDGQNCTYVGPPGPAVCSIQPVTYNYPLDSGNLAVCIFYNPSYPSVQYKKSDGTYPSATIKPIDFQLFISQNFTVTVGRQFSMPISVKNVGVFTDSYNINTNTTFNTENLVDLDPKTTNVTVGPLTGNSFGNYPETFSSLAKILVKSTESPINIIITANSTTNNTVYRDRLVQIRAGMSSLPDFGLLGLMQIILLAAAILFLKL